MPGWARQLWIMRLRKINPPQVDLLTTHDLIQKWRDYWTVKSKEPGYHEDTGLIATAFWLEDDGIATRLRATAEDDIKAASPELLKKVQMIKKAESLRTDGFKVTLCTACGQGPTLPLVAGRPAHSCAGCDRPIHTVLACPAAKVFAVPQEEGVYYCPSCAPPNALNENLLSLAQSRKQPAFQPRAVTDDHSAIGTRADAQVAIEQRLEARRGIPQPNFSEEPMEEGGSDEDAPLEGQTDDAGPSSNPFRPPPDTPHDDAPPAIAHVLVSDPSNTIQLDDEFVALQFHETCLEHGIPDFSSVCTAACLGKNQTGPWLIAVSTDAAQAISEGTLPSFECFTEDAEELTLRVLPCDPYGKPIRSTASKSHTDARKIDQKQQADEMKILLLFHLPPRCLGKSLAEGHLNRVREMIEATTKKMTGTKYSLIQGLTAKLKQKKNTLYLFLNPPLNLADPYRDIRPHLPELICLPYSADGLAPEPIACFMPPPMGVKLGLRTCCFRPPDICEPAANGGKCNFKKDLLRSWGIRPAVSDPGRDQREERKRARAESDARAYDAVNAAKALRVEAIKKKLCNFFSLGKVSPTPPPPSHHRTPTILHPIIVRQLELQAKARLWIRQDAHRLRLCTPRMAAGPGVTAPHLPLHIYGLQR